jgi:5-methyltetrahydrofolate--homocysteine methyltransferase
VGTVSALLDPQRRAALVRENLAEQERLRFVYEGRRERPLLSLADARARALRPDPAGAAPAPPFLGRCELADVDLAEIAACIDWTFFFHAWELKGVYPQILDDPAQGEAARDLFEHAQALLKRILDERLLSARGVYGYWRAASEGDDIVLELAEEGDGGGGAAAGGAPGAGSLRFPMLRQQEQADGERPRACLADFVLPRTAARPDHVGAFAVTAGFGADRLAEQFVRKHDDYHAIMVKALADRLAEACAAWLHARVRREWWGEAASDVRLSALLREKHRGIRPAFGYPACPDHSEKTKLFALLDAPALGMSLTESGAMLPAASVSGLYLGHSEARYLNVGRIDRDQVQDYATRKVMPPDEVERWLGPNLGYDAASPA